MTQPDRDTVMAVVDALLGGERIALMVGDGALMVGDGARPVELWLTEAFAARLRADLLKELQVLAAGLGPDADGYDAARDAAACYDAAIAAKRDKEIT